MSAGRVQARPEPPAAGASRRAVRRGPDRPAGRWRLWEERAAAALAALATAAVVAVLALILLAILLRGAPSLSVAMLTQTPKGGYYLGREGGILNAIVGSLLVAGGATALATLMALPVVACLNVYLRSASRVAWLVRLAMDVMWGVPSVVYGALAFIVMIWLGWRASLGAGILAVSLFVMPIIARAVDEVLRLVPPELGEASVCLGATRLETARRVILRQALPGLLTAMLLGFGRAMGDTAAVLFTAGFTDRVPTSLAEPAATLPLAVFFQLGSPLPAVQNRAYAAAFLLTVIVLAVSVAARALARGQEANVVGRR